MSEVDVGDLQEHLEGLVTRYLKEYENEVLQALACGLCKAGFVPVDDGGDTLASEVFAIATKRCDPLFAFGVARRCNEALFELPCYFGFDNGIKMVTLIFSNNPEAKSSYFVAEPKPVLKPEKAPVSALLIPRQKHYRFVDGKLVG